MTGRTVRIGLTGPIGCGKSTVARWLAELDGVVAIDADAVAREVLAPGTDAVEAVYRRFGEGLRMADGTLDRATLGRLVFSEATALEDLERIVHPAVRPRILDAIAAAEEAGARAVVIEAIKLVEGGLASLCDEVWLVTCGRAVQVERLVARGSSPDDAEVRITAQRDLIERVRPVADEIVDTSGTAAATRADVERRLAAALSRRA